jgi:tetratricopeptide (TPR) repeat protein
MGVDRARRLAEGALILLLVSAAFALVCQELGDTDIWWHLKAGQWIWTQGKVPTHDPFTFTSAERPWIDLHWLFQLMLAAAFAAGGVRGMIFMASGAFAAVLLMSVSARDRRWPCWLVVACWLPALAAMSQRSAPRPELFSLLGISLYLAVLRRADESPEVAWSLPIIQVLWVNSHGLFVLGPIVLIAYLAGPLSGSMWRLATGSSRRQAGTWRWWGHIGGATVMVGVACLLNPYGLRGALFPLEILPKITVWGGVYKSNILEYMSLQEYLHWLGPSLAADNLYCRCEIFLLWLLPLSFIVPAVWRASGQASPVQTFAWVCLFVLCAGLVGACVLSLHGSGTPGWMVGLGRPAPGGLVAIGLCGAALLTRRSQLAALLAALGGVTEAAWVVWLRTGLFGPEPDPGTWPGLPGPGSPLLGWGTALLGIATAGLALRAGGRLFRMLLAVMFGVLAIQAIRNINLFGLVAGYVLACNLGEWAAMLEPASSGEAKPRWLSTGPRAGLVVTIALCCLVGLLLWSIASGRFSRLTGERRRFGAFASPLAYAHDAARFAGQQGLPDRALAFGLRQAGVYMFHNGPGCKLFIDGQNEVHSRETFATYVLLDRLLNQGTPGWAEPVHRMDDPLILLDHENDFGAEATLLLDPGWRCIYHDAIASVFVSRRRRDLEASFPTVDFLARHFQFPGHVPARQADPLPWGLGEAKSLYNLASALRSRPGPKGPLRFSLSLLACDRLRQVLAADGSDAAAWAIMGSALWSMIPDHAVPRPGPEEPWDPARGLLPAQATFCFRRAVDRNPEESFAWSSLVRSFQARRMRDAQRSLAELMWRAGAAVANDDRGDDDDTEPGAGHDRPRSPLGPDTEQIPESRPDDRDGLSLSIARLLRTGHSVAAVRLFEESEDRGIVTDWPTRDRVAATLLHLGQPAQACRIWEQVADSPSPSLRVARIATAALAELDYQTAETTYRAALNIDPGQGEAWFGLALLHLQRGDAEEAFAAARRGRRQALTPAQDEFLQSVEALAAPYASKPRIRKAPEGLARPTD